MQCEVHAEVEASWAVDGRPACDACAREAEARGRDLGAGLLALVGVGYLGTLALGYEIFHARPLIGAIALGRVLQFWLKRPVLSEQPRPATPAAAPRT
jgi:hypothetical protein